MRFGEFDLHILKDGTFRLDGGAMFGVVPKLLWNRLSGADDQNRILLSLNCLLVQTGTENVLIDTGIGDKTEAKFRDLYAVSRSGVVEGLRGLGLGADDVNKVILTHLHFDHAGGSTTRNGAGDVVPTFRRATYFIQRSEWNEGLHPNERTRASYLKENYEPLQQAGQVVLLDGSAAIAPGISTRLTGGHTSSHQAVMIESGGRKAIYWGDLIPTAAHLKTPYVMGYDLYPLDTMRAKRELLDQAEQEHWLCIFEHDPQTAWGYLAREKTGLRLEPVPTD